MGIKDFTRKARRPLLIAGLSFSYLATQVPLIAQAGVSNNGWNLQKLTQFTTDTSDLRSEAYGNGTWLMLDDNNNLYQSTDGTNWSAQYIYGPDGTSTSDILYTGDKWVEVGIQGRIGVSSSLSGSWATSGLPPGYIWPKVDSGVPKDPPQSLPDDLMSVANNGSTVVAVGTTDGWDYTTNTPIYGDGVITTSTDDGTTWGVTKHLTTGGLWKVIHGGGLFVAVGDKGLIYTSADGTNWTDRSITTDDFVSVAYGSHHFVAVTGAGAVVSSTDGVTWTQLPDVSLPNVTQLTYGAGKFVAVTYDGNIFSSLDDGQTWGSELANSGSYEYYDVRYLNGKFIALGADGSTDVTQTKDEPVSSNANLTTLTVDSGTISPGFSSGTTSYDVDVDNSVATINLNPTPADSDSTVKVNGTSVSYGTSVALPLSVGANTETINVTAPDGTTKEYDVHITRDAPSTPPSAPTGLDHNNVSQSGWTETWSAVSGADSYNVYVNGQQVNASPITGTSYDVTGETAGTTYTVAITAVNAAGESSQSDTDSVTTSVAAPSAPTGLGNSNISQTGWTETWSSVNGADSYNVYVNGVKVNSSAITGTSYDVTGEAAGTTYTVTVTAVNAGGESSQSDADSVTTSAAPPAAPSAPTGLANSNISQTGWTETWFAVSGADSYNVYVNGVKVNSSAITGTSYDVTGEAAGTTYTVTVTAVNAGGESSQSDADSVTTSAAPPAAPTGLANSNISQTGWTETWSAVSGADSYNVYVNGVKVNASPITGTSYDVTGEAAGTTCTVTVTAVNAGGESAQSDSDSVTTSVAAPSAPTGLANSNISQTGWTETWSAVSGADSYNVYVNGAKVNASPITGTSYDVTGEAAGTTYTVTVTAVNAGGESSQSDADSVTTSAAPPAAPSAPTGLANSNISQTGWTETWSAVSGADSYNVYVNGAKVNASPITGTSYDVTGEAAGTTYTVTVTAVNAGGESAQSDSDSVTTSVAAPSAPTGLGNSNISQTGWTETWSAVSGADSYNVYVNGVKVNASSITGTSYDVTGETAGTTYTVTVTAVNAGGESAQSDSDSVTTSAASTTAPSAPTGLGHSNLSQTGWTETWSAVSGADSYNVYVNGVKVNASPITGTSYDVTGETAGTTYTVTVTAVNAGGESSQSDSDSVTTSAASTTAPNAPTELGHSNLSQTGWTETWSAVSGADSYNVYVNGVMVNASPITGTSYDVTGEAAGTTYTVTVTAVNAGGESAQSDSDSVTTSAASTTAPNAPTELGHSNLSQTGWTETWSAVSGADSYNVYVNGVKVNASPITGTSYDVTGEAAGTTYIVTVTAVNAGGESAQSDSDSVTTSAASTTAPNAPTELGHSNLSQTGWTETWSAVSGADSYNVYVNGVKVNASPITGTSYDVTGEAAGTTYTVTVTAVNAGGESAQSDSDSVKTSAASTTAPNAPTELGHSNLSQTGWTETWSAVSGADSYNVYVNGVKVNASPITGTSYDVTGEAAGTTYTVTVTAVNAGGESTDSTQDAVVVFSNPTGLSHSNITTTSWVETWDWDSHATSYNVFLNGQMVATGVKVPSYAFGGEAPDTTYTITVQPVDGDGIPGVMSNQDSVTTLSGSSNTDSGYAPVTQQLYNPTDPLEISDSNVSGSGTSVDLSVPAGSFISSQYIVVTSVPTNQLNHYRPSGMTTVGAIGIQFPETPTKSISLTVNNANILPGDIVYKVLSDGTFEQLPQGAFHVQQGQVTINFSADPDFVIAQPTNSGGGGGGTPSPGPGTSPSQPLKATDRPVVAPGAPGQPFNATLTAIGGTGSNQWSIVSGKLPNGLELNPTTGEISGTSKDTLPEILTVQVKDSSGEVSEETIVVDIVPSTEREMVWQTGQVLHAENVPAIVSKDAGVNTTYMPIWYVMQMLKAYGIHSSWNGHTWNLTVSQNASKNANGKYHGNIAGIYLEGKLLETVHTLVEVDPNSKQRTTYMPIWYVQQLLSKLQVSNTWNGETWLITQGDSGSISNQ